MSEPDSSPGLPAVSREGVARFTDSWHPADSTTPQDSLATPPTAPTVPGYEILEELGRGGMGVVYKARHLALKRTVALKMILAGAAAGSEQRRRFRAETEAAARLQHPNIVQVFEVGEADGLAYCALEYVSGGTLAAELRREPWPPRHGAEVVETLARAVAYAHAQGVLHRDLKPGNILLASPELTAKIADFGLARFLDDDASGTCSGAILGTPSYMAPEQAAGRTHELGPWTDVWALGAILYEAITGRPPFRGASVTEVLDQVRQRDPVAPRRLAPGCPRDLETICLKCLRKEPEKRYQTADVLADDLGRFLAGRPILARPVGAGERLWLWCRRRPTVALLTTATALSLLVALGVLVGAYVNVRSALAAAEYSEGQERLANRAASASAEERRQALSRVQVIRAARAQEDGDVLASLPWLGEALRMDRDEPARAADHRLRLASALRQCPRLEQMLFHQGQVSQVQFSPDGQRLLTASWDGHARLWQVDSGRELAVLRHDAAILAATFSPGGDWIATAANDKTVRVWDGRSGQPHGGPLVLEAPALCLAFSPDGKKLAAGGGWKLAPSVPRLRYIPLPDRVIYDTITIPGRPPLRVPRLVPGGRIPIYEPDTRPGTAQVWETQSGRTVAGPFEQRGWVNAVNFTPDGKKLLTVGAPSEREGELHLYELDNGKDVFPGGEELPQMAHAAAFSADGKRLIVGLGSDVQRKGEARVLDAATGKTLGKATHSGPVIQVAFGADPSLFLSASIDGSVWLWNLTSAQGVRLWHQGAVNGAVFASDRGTVLSWGDDWTARLWDARSGAPRGTRLRHSGPVTACAFSPDGQRLATADCDGVVRLWSLGESAHRVIAHDKPVTSVLYSPDGQRLVTATGAEVVHSLAEGGRLSVRRVPRVSQLHFRDLRGGKPAELPLDKAGFEERTSRLAPSRFSPDGRLFLVLIEPNAGEGATVALHELATGKRLAGATKPEGQLLDAGFCADGRCLLALAFEDTARVWHLDADGLRPVTASLKSTGAVLSAALSQNGQSLFLVSKRPGGLAAQRWSLKDGTATTPPLSVQGDGPSASASAVCDPQGRRVLLVLRRAQIDPVRAVEMVLWNVDQARHVVLAHHRDIVEHAQFSHDGRLLVTASADRTACLWDADSGRPVGQPLIHQDRVVHADFSADGRAVVTCSRDATARVWTTTTGEPLTPPLRHRDAVLHAAFRGDGLQLATASLDGSARLWDLTPEASSEEDLLPLLHVLASASVDASGSPAPLSRDSLAELWRRAVPLVRSGYNGGGHR